MDVLVALLADVAVLRLDDLAELGLVDVELLELLRDVDVRRREHRLGAVDADARLGEHALVAADPRRLLLAAHDLVEAAPLDDVGVVDVPREREQPRALLQRQFLQQAAVGDDLLERIGDCLQALGDAVLLIRGHARRVAPRGLQPRAIRKALSEPEERESRMSTTAIVVIVIAVIVVLAIGWYILKQRGERQLEERRLEADEQRSLADTKAREAEQARLAAEEQAERARARQAEAEDHRRQADEVDPDVDVDAEADADTTTEEKEKV